MTTITIGSRVKFNRDGKQIIGTVFYTTLDIGNSRKMAIIELEHKLAGIMEHVPFDALSLAPQIPAVPPFTLKSGQML